MKCRVCNSEKLTPYIDLGMMPLSNNLLEAADSHAERYPLKVLFCEDCGLSQLSVVIDPEVLFSNYVYRSSINQGYVDHCREMAYDLQDKYKLTEQSLVIDIAGNDGALLQQFEEVIGCRVLNVDPAKNLAKICLEKRIPMITQFWDKEIAGWVVNNHGHADLITATNVFAHVDDVRGFLEAASNALKPEGVLVLEFPYLIDFIEGKEFDTIYFEHLSYFSIRPLAVLCKELGLNILNVQKQDIHGGSVRVTIGHGIRDASVSEFIKTEREHYSTIEPYLNFNKAVQETIKNFREKVLSLEGTVAGFAASAKGNILLNSAGLHLSYIVDQTPEKIGKYSPGLGTKIVGMDELINNPPDYLIILSWNFADEIMNKCTEAGYEGKFIIPIPEFKIIDNVSLYAATA